VNEQRTREGTSSGVERFLSMTKRWPVPTVTHPDFNGCQTTLPTPKGPQRASELRALHRQLRLPDAIVLASAQEFGGRLLSYDRRLSQLADKSG
jgi:predicted nucleic acid-binding protein